MTELSAIKIALDDIAARLDRLEASQAMPKRSLNSHPSMEKFAIAEAIADEIFAAKGKEKACTFEPNDKPCDHCSMCSSRGF
ncbi:MAG: hypothetical protein KF685_11765 [Acidobacteria bacterium]|nr:hypothetical protein [Acidobacteriota bacterium]